MTETRTTIESAIRDAAEQDPSFRAALVADPAAAITARYGMALPDSITVRIVEETADEVVLVLPADRTPPVEEQLLDIASGGRLTDPYVTVACTNACATLYDCS